MVRSLVIAAAACGAAACITVEQGSSDAGAAKTDATSAEAGTDSDTGTCTPKIAGPKAPSNTREIAAGGLSWSNPDRATSVDGSAAVCSVERGEKTNTLVFEGFGFSVPATARVTGVEFSITRKGADGNSTSTRDLVAQPFPALGGINMPKSAEWGFTYSTVLYGGSTETFGVALTPAVVNGTDFAMAFAGAFDGPNLDNTLSVDGASARVFYCE